MIIKNREVATASASLHQPTSALNQRPDHSQDLWREAILPYLGTRGILLLVGLLAQFYILPVLKSNPILPSVAMNTHFPDALWLMWRRFDGGFYVDIAEHGYW